MREWAVARRRVARGAFNVFVLLTLALLLAACGEALTPTVPPADVAARPAPPTVVLPTLYPTATRAHQQPTPTREMPATRLPESTADLQQTVVSFRYRIPALGLDRRLEGTVGGTVTVVDEAAGLAATLPNQGGVLFDLQSTLPELKLAELPDDCAGCVAFSYSLPIEGAEDSGWLQDPVMLASIENYLALTLGPHWPDGTVVGLRRSASPYHVAHTVAFTADGAMYRWLATEREVRDFEEASLPSLPNEVAALDEDYSVVCPGVPLETLYLPPADDGEETRGTTISISCPAFSLPASLLSTYLALDERLAPLLVDEQIPVPPSEIPLAAMVVYEWQGQGRLILLSDDRVVLETSSGETFTDTLSAGTAMSMTATLEASEALVSGVSAYTAAEGAHILLVRTGAGMAEAAWDDSPPEALVPVLTALEAWWDELAPEATPEAGSTGTATLEGAGTAPPPVTGTTTPQVTLTP
jgi:predicted small lipoprotein YifL